MATALAVVRPDDHTTPRGSKLDRLEHKLAKAMSDQYEAFYQQGVILQEMAQDTFREAGYTSFNEYLNDRQPLGIKQRLAWYLIAAMKIRPLLPDIECTGVHSGWTEGTVRPLTHKSVHPADVKRIGKKIATQVRKGRVLTATLVCKCSYLEEELAAYEAFVNDLVKEVKILTKHLQILGKVES